MLDELRRWTDALAVLRTPAVTDPIAT
jgi:hypothetical protein